MIREEILKMHSGQDLDILVAKEIMGYSIYHYDKDHPNNCYYMLVDKNGEQVAPYEGWRSGEKKTEKLAWEDCPEFSSDISLAWDIYMERMEGFFSRRKRFYDELQFLTKTERGITAYPDVFTSLRHKMPESICKAALLSKLRNE